MEENRITAVGIDVSKGKSMISVLQPGGVFILEPFSVNHSHAELAVLVHTLSQIEGNVRIVMEHAGMYWQPIALVLRKVGFCQYCQHNVNPSF